LAFAVLLLVPALSFLMNAVALRAISDTSSMDWYRRRVRSLDLVLDLCAFCIPAIIGLTLLQTVVLGLLAPFLMLESGPTFLLIVGLTGIALCVLVPVVRIGHRMRRYALESRILEQR